MESSTFDAVFQTTQGPRADVQRVRCESLAEAQSLVEALLALPLVLPPTVLGYYLLTAFGGAAR